MPDLTWSIESGYLPHCAQKVTQFPEKSDFMGEIGKDRYLNVVYKVPNKSCNIAIFPPDLHSSEVVSWDDLGRGNREIKCHKPFRYVG